MDPQICKHLIESIPRRLQAVIKVKGGPSKYSTILFGIKQICMHEMEVNLKGMMHLK